jgi:hypothetical protein
MLPRLRIAEATHEKVPSPVRARTLVKGTCTAQLRCPHPLPSPARPAQLSEPILIPKLRIWLADFPYLHCPIGQRLFTLETCCGYGYGQAQKSYRSHGFSRDGGSAPDTARAAVLYRNNVHISGQADSMESVLYKEKKTLPGTPADSLRVRLRYRHGSRRLAKGQVRRDRLLCPGSGILT